MRTAFAASMYLYPDRRHLRIVAKLLEQTKSPRQSEFIARLSEAQRTAAAE
jgi:hypothetical protein